MNKEEHKTNTHYCILEVHETATQEQIKAAYSTMFKRWHPDLNSLKKGSECTICMQHINKAYSVLQDPNSRAQYDNLLRLIRSSEAPRAQSYQTYTSRPVNPKSSTGNSTYARDPNPSPANRIWRHGKRYRQSILAAVQARMQGDLHYREIYFHYLLLLYLIAVDV